MSLRIPVLLMALLLGLASAARAALPILRPLEPSAANTSPSRADKEVLWGTLGAFDTSSGELTLRRGGQEDHLVVNASSILREGSHRIQPSMLWEFRGHSTKARVVRMSDDDVITDMIVSPERVTSGKLVKIDPISRSLVIDTAEGEQWFTLEPESWGRVKDQVTPLSALPPYVGHPVKVTTAIEGGHVISVRVFASKPS